MCGWGLDDNNFTAGKLKFFPVAVLTTWRTGGTVKARLEMSDSCSDQREEVLVSSSPNFAQIFMFLQNFGPLLAFPTVFLSDLENFFLRGKLSRY